MDALLSCIYDIIYFRETFDVIVLGNQMYMIWLSCDIT